MNKFVKKTLFMGKMLKSQKTTRCEVETDDDFNVTEEFTQYIANYTEYTKAGNVRAELSYNANNELQEKIEYVYDENDILREQLMYYDENEVVERRTYDYNDNLELVRANKYYEEGTFEYTLYFYNNEGLLTEKKKYNQDDELEEIEEFDYQEGKLTAEKKFDHKKKLIYEQKLIKDGNILERIIFDIDNGTTRVCEEFDDDGRKMKTMLYDKKDRLVSRSSYTYENGNVSMIALETSAGTETTMLHYNDHADVVLQEEIDVNDFYKSRITREFDEDNVLLKTQVYVNNNGKSADLNYILKFDYEYFE